MLQFLQGLPSPIAQGMIWGIMAIGVYITYKVLDVADLTVDGSLATGGAVLVVLTTQYNVNIYLALVIAFCAGCVAGLVTGLFHTKFGIPAILAGILTQLALYSVNLRIMSGRSNTTISWRNYSLIVTSKTDMLGYTILKCAIIVAVLIAVLYWFFGTEMGHSIRATGNNLTMARSNGINTDSRKIIGLVLSNGIVAMSGGLLAQFSGAADINMGRGAIVIGLAAVIIGEVLLGKFFDNFAWKLVCVVIGGIVYYIVIALVLKMGLDANDLKLLSAVVVAVFLAIPHWNSKFSFGKKKKAKEAAE
ncbi:MAG: ABC transporter permease [Oscillospiraceae bacterium]|nr:ABC transporter permease [Oscillospiraceae bacterium]